MFRPQLASAVSLWAMLLSAVPPVTARPNVTIVGDWQVRVSPGTVLVGKTTVTMPRPVTLTVAPSESVTVHNEEYEGLPLFNEKASGWTKGVPLRGLRTLEVTAPDRLDPQSLVLRSAPDAPEPLRKGVDYAVDEQWATVGRLPGGAIPEGRPVWADYRYGRNRLDAVVVDRRGAVRLVRGVPDLATPHAPPPPPGTVALANLWVPGRLAALTRDNLYPIEEAKFPEATRAGDAPAAGLLPKTWAKLHDGRPLRILAWGDSVTAGGGASDPAHRYQDRFLALLRQQFPRAAITLTTEAWPGHNSVQYLAEPAGSPHNLDEKVVRPQYDLVVMEFVNDAGLSPESLPPLYGDILARLQAVGSEWIILTPHFTYPAWMGSPTARITHDPRPYVSAARAFAARNHVALADASRRWEHLLREGTPYTTLLANSVNHPDDRGHEIYARSLIALFDAPHRSRPETSVGSPPSASRPVQIRSRTR